MIYFNASEYAGEDDPVFKDVPWDIVDITPAFISSVKAGTSNILKEYNKSRNMRGERYTPSTPPSSVNVVLLRRFLG